MNIGKIMDETIVNVLVSKYINSIYAPVNIPINLLKYFALLLFL